MTALGERVRELRLSRGLPPRSFAALLGVDTSLLYDLERGSRKRIPAWLVGKLAETFGVPEAGLWALVPCQRREGDGIPLAHPIAPSRLDRIAPTALAARVKELRIQLGLTQGAVAVKAGLGPSFLKDLEAGKRRYVEASHIEKLAAALGVPEEELWAMIPGGKSDARYIPLVEWR